MPYFSKRSKDNLLTCHIDLQVLFNEVIKTFDCIVTEGYRNKADQEKAFANGNTKLHYPYGNHNKNPSLAADVYPYPINFDDERLALWFGGYVLGIAEMLKDEGTMNHAIRWGGAWNGLGKLNTGNMLNDTGHFELVL